MIPTTAKYLTPQHEWPDYGFKAGHKYEIKLLDGKRYIMADGPSFLDTGEIRPEILQDFIIE